MNILYGVPLSPFVRKVMLVLAYKGIDYKLKTILPFATPDDWAAVHPLRKVPVFEDDYVKLPDSTVICQYLEETYPQNPIYPANAADKARILWIEEFADTGLMDCLGFGLFFERLVKPAVIGKPSDEAKVEHTITTRLPPLLDYLEGELDGHRFWSSETPTIVDFTIPGMFLNARYADYTVDAARWPKLAGYLQRAWEYPLFAEQIDSESRNLAHLKSAG